MVDHLKTIFKRGFWIFILAWIFVIYKIKILFGASYSADSYAFYFLGHNLITGQGYSAPSIRDLYLDPNGPLLSRSYPPLVPLLIGITDFFLQEKIAAGPVINLFICMAGLYLWFIFSKRVSNYLFFIPFIIPILCTFVPYDHALWRDAMAGRSSPLTLPLFLAVLLLLSKSTLLTDNKIPIGVGIFLGLLTLTRFDTVLFCFALPTAVFLTTKLSFRKTLLMYVALIAVMLPWAVRNYVVFGSFLASSEAMTALSIAVGIGPLTFFEQSPPLGIDHPQVWLAQRMTYLKSNTAYVYSLLTTVVQLGESGKYISIILKLFTFLYVPGFIYSFITRKQNHALWIFFVGSLTWATFNILCIALTPYVADARYYVVSTFTIMGGSAFFIVICIQKSVNALFKKESSVDTKKVGSATIWVESLLCIAMVFVTIHLYSKFIYYNQQDPFWKWGKHIENTPVKKGEYVAAIQAEKIAYYTGWNTIYLPGNQPALPESASHNDNQKVWENYRAWLKHWKPSYLLFEVYDFYNPLTEYPHATVSTILDTMILFKINLDESVLTEQDAANDAKKRDAWKQVIHSRIPPKETFFLNSPDFINGVSLKWEGFYVQNIPENQKKFAEGRVVLLPNGEHRLIKTAYFIDARWYARVYGGLIPTGFSITADQFETIDNDERNTFFITNDTWVRGVAIKWAGFMIQNTAKNQQEFKEGYIVQLPTGDKRTITKITNDPSTLYVTLSGDPMDGYKVGTPAHFKVFKKAP